MDDVRREMPSPPVDSTHGRTMSVVALHHRPWTARMVERCRAWYDITALSQHTWSNDAGEACHHRLWAAHTVRLRRAWHDITALGQHTRSDDVGRGMTSWPLNSTRGRTTLGVACHHSPWTTNTIEQRRAWHDIISFGQHTQSNDVGRGMQL